MEGNCAGKSCTASDFLKGTQLNNSMGDHPSSKIESSMFELESKTFTCIEIG